MEMKMKSVCLFFLLLITLKAICCQGCWKQEGHALLALYARFGNHKYWTDDADCCQLERVECNAPTGRVSKLTLSQMGDGSPRPSSWKLNYSDFLVFEDLKTLDLSSNGIVGCVGNEGLSSMLINLEVLNISGTNINESDIGSTLSGFSSLNTLNVGNSQLTPRSIRNISKLSSLEILDLSENNLNDSVLWSLENEGFTWPINLRVLGLSGNSFSSSNFLSSLSGLQHIKSLDLSSNQLQGSLNISGLLSLNNLEILDLSNNYISDFVVHQGSKSLNRLEVLVLDGNNMDGNMLEKSLRAFSSIRVLSLVSNEFKGTIVARDFHNLHNLEHLAMDNSFKLENKFFKSIGALTSLKVLTMSICHINGTLPAADWSKLKKLEELDLNNNEFEGLLPTSFGNMTSLHTLSLSYNHFNGNFSSNLVSLTSLEYLEFRENQFEVPISFTPFANHSNLKFIYGDGNKVILDSHPTLKTWVPKFQLQQLSLSSTSGTNSLPLPNFLLYQYNLTSLDFTSCKLEGKFPSWLLENNTKMTNLVLRNCSFTGTFHLPSHPLLSLENIDVSDNDITGQIWSNNISSIFPNLLFLNMSINRIHGFFPHDIFQMNSLSKLDLSENQLFGEIPKNVSRDRSLLNFLKLSNNKLDGCLFPTLSTFNQLISLYLDGNSLSGTIPSNFLNTSLAVLDISNNFLAGKLPTRVENSSHLTVLSMSSNYLEGSIPSKFGELESLVYLDISHNNLTGYVPSFINTSIGFLHLNNNRLNGLVKRMFQENPIIIDLSNNEINSSIHDMIQDLGHTRLSILLLKGNNFTGRIPKQLCQQKDLTILDLSNNNLFGLIPNCLGQISFENEDAVYEATTFGDLYQVGFGRRNQYVVPLEKEKVDFTTKKRSYTYTGNILAFMTGIDLSSNKLNGDIPFELGNWTKIRAVNLSHNNLTGQIPATFVNLVQIESLDLSFNKFIGEIPHQLSELTFLAVFSIAHNNLSGSTPDRKGQFMTFDESSYVDNPFLCGPPLPRSCTPYVQPHAYLPNDSYADGDTNNSLVDMYFFKASFIGSYTLVLLVIALVLYINPYWRQGWFYYIELIIMNCYYFIVDNLCMIQIIGNM